MKKTTPSTTTTPPTQLVQLRPMVVSRSMPRFSGGRTGRVGLIGSSGGGAGGDATGLGGWGMATGMLGAASPTNRSMTPTRCSSRPTLAVNSSVGLNNVSGMGLLLLVSIYYHILDGWRLQWDFHELVR